MSRGEDPTSQLTSFATFLLIGSPHLIVVLHILPSSGQHWGEALIRPPPLQLIPCQCECVMCGCKSAVNALEVHSVCVRLGDADAP